MDIVLLHQTLTAHSLVGDDLCCMYTLLRDQGYSVHVFSEDPLTDPFDYISRDELNRLCQSKDSLLVYHHSDYWEEGEKILDTASAQLIIRYHSITPEIFFTCYDSAAAERCRKGREQTLRFAEKYQQALWLSDSEFNLNELRLASRVSHQILPPFNRIQALQAHNPSEEILKQLLLNPSVNLLFIGERVVPNINYEDLFKIVYDYKHRYNKNIKLHLVGKRNPALGRYHALLDQIIVQADLHENICWVDEMDDGTVLSYLIGCDMFVSTSLHEGFSVPLLEAQIFSLPVIARDSSVISETMGDGCLSLGENVQSYSAAIHLLTKNDDMKKTLIDCGRKNYQNRFNPRPNEKVFCSLIEEVAPR